MRSDQIRELYDKDYARTYNDKYIFSDLARSDAAFEIEVLGRLLKAGGPWLDVACGTGYFLSKFPDFDRAGLDVSQAMLEVARAENPGVEFFERDFREEFPDWNSRWKLVSCMWYAYGLVDTIEEMKRVLKNLADWTSEDGTCFLPICDPEAILGATIPYRPSSPWVGDVRLTGLTWSYIEQGGKRHDLIALHTDYLREILGKHFKSIEIIEYPPAMPGWEIRRRAIIAREKTDSK